eukprot:6188933-Pleurochrysis_carterae.AAC.1
MENAEYSAFTRQKKLLEEIEAHVEGGRQKGVEVVEDEQERNQIQDASRVTGYRLVVNGGWRRVQNERSATALASLVRAGSSLRGRLAKRMQFRNDF